MPQELSPRVFALTALLYYLANAYIQGNLQNAGHDAWLAVLLGTVCFLPVFLLFAALSVRYPGQDLLSVSGKVWGVWGQRVVGLILLGYAVYLLSQSLARFARFVSAYILPDTPKALMMALLLLLAVILVRRSAAVVGRWAGIVLPAVLIVIGMALIASGTALQMGELLPLGKAGLTLLRGAGESMVFPFGEPLALFTLLTCVKGEVKRRHWLLPWMGAGLLLALTFARNSMVLGGELAAVLPFATHHADSVMGYSSFSLRIEALTSLIPAAAGIVEATVFLHLAVHALEAASGHCGNRVMLLATAVSAGILALAMPGEWVNSAGRMWLPVSLSLQVILPSALLITAGMKRSSRRKILARRLKRQMR